jgi:hypothetical protein
MVDLAMLQSVSYIVGAIGVCIAAISYTTNLINNNKTRRTEIVRDILDSHHSYEDVRISNEVFEEMEYENWEDFLNKYAHGDKEAYRKFIFIWVYHDRLGYLLREGYVTPDTLFSLGGYSVLFLWGKFEPIDVEMKHVFGESYLPYVKYLALEMVKVKKRREPGYVIPEQFSKYMTS